nr:putative callose synthase 8 [Quercus suber]
MDKGGRRPRTIPWKEGGRKVQCGLCDQEGHNRRTCLKLNEIPTSGGLAERKSQRSSLGRQCEIGLHSGQTLSRTVRGMMYHREALKLQAFIDIAAEEDILHGYDIAGKGNHKFSA